MRGASRWSTAAALLAGAAASVVASACSVLTTYDGFAADGTDAPELHASCGRRVPPRPQGAARGGTIEALGMATEGWFLDAPGRVPLGFNLDGRCTCPGARACAPMTGSSAHCDAPETGVDNAGGDILALMFRDQELLSRNLAVGLHGLAVRVQGYNGQPDDPDVSVALYNVVGLDGATDGSRTARFDGSDELLVDQLSVLEAGDLVPRYFDTSAYVAGGKLVATLDFELRLLVPRTFEGASVVRVPLRNAQVVGALETTGQGLVMREAQLVGRIRVDQIFEQIASIGICPDTSVFENMRQTTCAALDIPSDPARDGQDAACDALSIAFGFSIVPARLGGAANVIPPLSPCGAVDGATVRCR